MIKSYTKTHQNALLKEEHENVWR